MGFKEEVSELVEHWDDEAWMLKKGFEVRGDIISGLIKKLDSKQEEIIELRKSLERYKKVEEELENCGVQALFVRGRKK